MNANLGFSHLIASIDMCIEYTEITKQIAMLFSSIHRDTQGGIISRIC